MLNTMKDQFNSLTKAQAAIVSGALTAKKAKGYKAPKTISGEAVFKACEAAKVQPTTIVTALAGESSPEAVTTIEKLTGKKIQKAATKKPAAKKANSGGSSGASRSAYADDPRIVVYKKEGHEKRGKSKARWEVYQVGMTVAECIAGGVIGPDIPWDTDPTRQLIKLASPDSKEGKEARAAYLKANPKKEAA